MARVESVGMLLDGVRGLSEADAEMVAEALGDLPLGVAQAATFMADTGMRPSEYVDLLLTRAAEICAFLAPEPVPAEWFPNAAGHLPDPLGGQTADPIAWGQIITRLRGSALVRVNPGGLLMHRLTQAIIRHHLSREDSFRAWKSALVLLRDQHIDVELPDNWPAYKRLLPHMYTVVPATEKELRATLAQARAALDRLG